MVDIFSVFLLELEIYLCDRFQKLSQLTNWIFLQIKLYILEKNCLISSKLQKCEKFSD